MSDNWMRDMHPSLDAPPMPEGHVQRISPLVVALAYAALVGLMAGVLILAAF